MKHVHFDAWNIRPDRVREIAEDLQKGRTALVPTDTTWTLICDASSNAAISRLRAWREESRGGAPVPTDRPLSLMCGNLSDVGKFTLQNQSQFRLVKRLLPGAYTIILPVSLQVPKVLHTRRKVIGVRFPEHDVTTQIINAFGAPVFATTARRADGELLSSTAEIEGALERYVDVVAEVEPFVPEPTTVLDATGDSVTVLREGRGVVEDHWHKDGETF